LRRYLTRVLAALVVDIVVDAIPRLTFDFLVGYPSRFAEKAGIAAALAGSAALMVLTAVIALPIGVGAAIYLEEYAEKSRYTQFIEINIANLAGVPSIIYGILGLQLFVRFAGLGRSLISGALTLAILVLPIIIIASREALRCVPKSIREGSLALGATKWQTIWHQVLPPAMPAILTGCILAFSRAIGEAAPLITMGALTYVAFLPDSLTSPFTALPIQAFNWISRPQAAFHHNAAAAIVVLLIMLLTLNSIAIILRHRYRGR
jgi:phosphate transport system permease protein